MSATAQHRDRTVVVCEGDETGQELLEQSLRVLDSDLVRSLVAVERFDLSLGNRRRTRNEVATLGCAADGVRTTGLGGTARTSEVVTEVLARLEDASSTSSS